MCLPPVWRMVQDAAVTVELVAVAWAGVLQLPAAAVEGCQPLKAQTSLCWRPPDRVGGFPAAC